MTAAHKAHIAMRKRGLQALVIFTARNFNAAELQQMRIDELRIPKRKAPRT